MGYFPNWTLKTSGVVMPDERLPTGQTLIAGLQHVVAMFGATVLAPVLMGSLISMGGGWTSLHGYSVCFLVMAGCALGGALLQLLCQRATPSPALPEFQNNTDAPSGRAGGAPMSLDKRLVP